MNAILKMKSGRIYDVFVTDLSMSRGMSPYPEAGVIEIDEEVIEEFKNEASSAGSWQEAMSVDLELSVKSVLYDLEILLKEIPITNTVSFSTTKYLENA